MTNNSTSLICSTLVQSFRDTAGNIFPGSVVSEEKSEHLLFLPGDLEQEVPQPSIPTGTTAWKLDLGSFGKRYFIVAPITSPRLSQGDSADALMAAVRFRAYLSPLERSDLYLFLVAPRGSPKSPEWVQATKNIERNEFFCRIFVWLPSEDQKQWATHSGSIVNKMFISKLPFDSGTQENLSPAITLLSSLPLPQNVKDEWGRILLQNSRSNKETMAKLVSSIIHQNNIEE